MKHFDIIAHRGVSTSAPENTLLAFQQAIDLGADAVELDVRLTSDHVPVVFHYYYLETITPISGAIFNFRYEDLKHIPVQGRETAGRISTLEEIMDVIGGKIGLEIEIKGPELESVDAIADILSDYKNLWPGIEITSYEPVLLLEIRKRCPDLVTDLLFRRSEPWMNMDVVAYQALHYARLAQARAIHLHPTQLSEEIVNTLRQRGIEVHTWDVNDEKSLRIISDLEVPRICTDNFLQAYDFRRQLLT